MTNTGSHAHAQAIGLDLGGTKLHAGTTTKDGMSGLQIVEPTDAASEELVLAQIVSMVEALRDDRRKASIVLGAPGAVDQTKGTIDLSPNIPFSSGRPIANELSAALGETVLVENDVNLATLAEARLGAGRGLGIVCFLSFGTGVGAGIVRDGHIMRGANGRAGEISYLPLGSDPIAAAARSTAGQFEDRVGTNAIRTLYGRDMPDVRTLFARADAGDAAAARAIEATASAAASGLASLQLLLDPDLVVIGGGIGTQPRFFDRLCEDAAKLLDFPLAVAPAALGQAAGMLGALVLAADHAGLPTVGLDMTPPPHTMTPPA
ncbi:ROK family protein [Jiella mangrovi]|uniref:ROK family protein n=1 Tax=Jiella mangrovi TaxID=2821407 RepID=A0ABS4BGD1_9HYPH|nr:ROK family protein [Jiella mangrovi]MBP0615807.1 ROK family protein [Jiella mangrovi]